MAKRASRQPRMGTSNKPKNIPQDIGKRNLDPWDPDTWPVAARRRLNREMQMRDIMCGTSVAHSPKALMLKEYTKSERPYNAPRHTLNVDEHMLELISDLQALHKLGTFRFMPLAVREQYKKRFGAPFPFDLDTVNEPKSRSWSISHMVRMSLMVSMLYLMGLDPYTSTVMKRYLTIDLHKVAYKTAVSGIETSAEFFEKYETDDDFDFTDLGFADI